MRIIVTGGSGFIGTNYMEYLVQKGADEFINIDFRPPRNKEHYKHWRQCDILDRSNLEKTIKEFSPTHVVHLAAKTGLTQKELSEFAANIEGVDNMLQILNEVPTMESAIFTSTLLVCEMGYVPKTDTDYRPTTLYGKSKVEGEKLIRGKKALNYSWTIVRPISVWGPWAEEPYRNFFKAVAHNWYFHIGSGHYKRSMGYVENMANQIYQILLAENKKVAKKTFYLGDNHPVDLYEFANETQKVLAVGKNRQLPLGLVKCVAKAGDILKFLGWKSVPLTSFRLKNIRTEYVFDLSPIIAIAGEPLYDYKKGIKRTVEWMKKVGEI